MGYTHYWKISEPLERDAFGAWAAEVKQIAKHSKILLVGWNGERTAAPEYNDAEVNFNGCATQSHENFGVREGDAGFSFCKTARKPYDEVVTGALILLAARFPQVEVSSDGTADEWLDGLRLARKVNPAAQIPAGVHGAGI